jgi:hypothetical protein
MLGRDEILMNHSGQPNPADVGAICSGGSPQVQKAINDLCGGDAPSVLSTYSDACQAAGKTIGKRADQAGPSNVLTTDSNQSSQLDIFVQFFVHVINQASKLVFYYIRLVSIYYPRLEYDICYWVRSFCSICLASIPVQSAQRAIESCHQMSSIWRAMLTVDSSTGFVSSSGALPTGKVATVHQSMPTANVFQALSRLAWLLLPPEQPNLLQSVQVQHQSTWPTPLEP